MAGVYTLQGISGGMDYWVHADGSFALWYTSRWRIGNIEDLGTDVILMDTQYSNTLEKKCPNNEGYIWNWLYGDEMTDTFIATDDIHIKCENENEFCTSENPCGTDEGDCDTHDECQNGLVCGSNNCPDDLGFHSEFDCWDTSFLVYHFDFQ